MTGGVPYGICLLRFLNILKMEKLWNDFELKKPPFLTLPSCHTKFVVEVHGIIETYFSKHSAHEDEFNETAALLGRLMARRKNSFMRMKGFKDLCKLNAALCRLLRVDFKRDLDSFRYTLPDVAYDEGTIIHLPTRDTYDYLLIRLIAVSELYKRIGECCVVAAEYFTSQLRIHYFFEINTLLLAVIAKIYSFSIKLGNLAIHFYNNLQRYRFEFPINAKSKFLQNSTNLPLKLDTIKRTQVMEEQTAAATKNMQSPAEQTISALLKQEQQITQTVKAKNLKKMDLGTAVERSNAKTSFNIEELRTVTDIKTFISAETKERTKNPSSCTTKQVLAHEWSGATKLFERKVQNGEEKKAISIFKKFIGSKL